MKPLLVICVLSLLVACEPLEDKFWDCLDQDGPRFNVEELPTGVLFQSYEASIRAYITREARDDDYLYDFSWSGSLPPGIAVERHSDGRRLTFYGAPVAPGEYSVTVSVRVYSYYGDENYNIFDEDYDDGDNLCKDHYKKTFTINVVQSD